MGGGGNKRSGVKKKYILGNPYTLGNLPRGAQEIHARFVFKRMVLKREVHCEWLQEQMLQLKKSKKKLLKLRKGGCVVFKIDT